MFNLKEYREPTNRLPDFLPWAGMAAPGVVLQKDGLLQKSVAFRGPDLASSSASELISANARLNNALKRLGSGWALFSEAQRYSHDHYLSSAWDNPCGWLIDMERKNQFKQAGAHYESSYILTFVWMMPSLQQKKMGAVFYDDPESDQMRDDNSRDLQYFQKTISELVDIMAGVFAEVGELDDEQTLTYLHSTVSMSRHPIKMPHTPFYFDALLPDTPFTPGDIPMLGDYFIPTCTISGYPADSFPGILDALNYLQVEYRWVTRYIALDKLDAKKEIERYRKNWWQKRKKLSQMMKEEATQEESAFVDSDAAQKASDADAALLELGDDIVSYGYITNTISTWHTDIDVARKRMQDIKQVIQSNGFAVTDETLNSQDAWLGSLPGHVWGNVRRPMCNTLNLSHVMPLSAIWAGSHQNEHLKKVTGQGNPHIVCSTTGATPFRLNLNVGDVGHALIIGPTGAGKSVLLCMLELQWLKYPGAKVVIFDKDRSARAATLAVGGNIYEPGNEDAPISFQPFANIHLAAERTWAANYTESILTIQGIDITPAVKKEVDDALKNLAETTVAERTFTVLSALIQDDAIRQALRPYTLDGNFGQLMDGAKDDMRSGFWQMIEMNEVMEMGDAAVIPTLEYLFHKVDGMMGSGPMLLVLDEAWLFLSHKVFAKKLRSWLKTVRKKDVYVVFATQEIADAVANPILPTILSACHTKIYLPDEEALTPLMMEAYQHFGLSEAEVFLLANAQKKRDYYYRSSKGRRLFSLDMGEVSLAFAAMSSTKDHRFMDKMVVNHPPEAYATEILKHRGLDWAADLYQKSLPRLIANRVLEI